MKLEIGVCKAKPSSKEINPNDTTAVYQLTNKTEMVMNPTARTTINLKIRFKLKRATGFAIRPKAKTSTPLATARTKTTHMAPSVSLDNRVSKCSPNHSLFQCSKVSQPANNARTKP